MDFAQLEETDGTRWTWHFWPSSRLDASRCVVPFASMYTPLKEVADAPVLPYGPVVSRDGAVLNPYCNVDFRARMWVCPFTFQRNQLPPQYADISDTNLPAELLPQHTVVEYKLPRQPAPPPAFLFVLDTSLREDQLEVAKEYVMKSLTLLPPEAAVGLITFGHNVHVHEIGFSEAAKSYVLRGTKDYTAATLQTLLGLSFGGGGMAGGGGGGGVSAQGVARFLQPVSECEFTLTTILEELGRDPWPVPTDQRPRRCTGAALSVAAALLECTYAGYGAHICLLLGGPSTQGPGLLVSSQLEEEVRSHTDIEKDNVPHMKKAVKHYDDVATRLVNAGHALSVWGCSLDQVGLFEMKSCVDRTGGVFVMSESFMHPMFKRSFEKFFERDPDGYLKRHFQATIELDCSREFKVAGMIGPCASLERKSACVSQESEVGIGGTCAWRIPSLDADTSLGVFYEIVNQHSNPIPDGHYRYVQFRTTYQHSSGEYRMRVATCAGRWCDGSDLVTVASGFDQEAAAVLMARLAVFKTENEEAFDILRWLDRMLIRLCARFAEYQKDHAESFRLGPSLSLYPQFMFNLRRSPLLQVFNTSPDESAFFRSHLARVGVLDGLLMIQPTLIQYTLDQPPSPVLLDVASVRHDAALLLDAFFYVIVFTGDSIAQWRKAGYHLQPNYRNLAEMIEAPKRDAEQLLDGRFPYPRYIESDQHGSQSRFLLAKLNPSSTHMSGADALGVGGGGGGGGASSEFLFTDDVSLQVFMEHLKRLAVASQ